MRIRLTLGTLCVTAALASPVQGQDDAQASRIDRIQAAVNAIVAIQHGEGEAAAIAAIQSCYQSLPEGRRTDRLDECLSQDIAYANFSAGMYRNVLKSAKQPDYPSMAALGPRVYAQSMRVGMSRKEADAFLRALAPFAIQALQPAIESLGH